MVLPSESTQNQLPTEGLPEPVKKSKKVFFVSSLFGLWGFAGFALGFGLALLLQNKMQKEEKKIDVSTPVLPSTSFSKIELLDRTQQALQSNRNLKVIYEDVLGEGEGSWDSDPVYPGDKVNCMVWIEKLVSEIYAKTSQERYQVMNRIRYFDGVSSFGTRKHFLPMLFNLDPGPFQHVDVSGCAALSQEQVQFDFDRFKKSSGYSCSLYGENVKNFAIQYVTPDGLLNCARSLPAGYYFLFAVPTEKYNQKYGKKSGPLGLVHGIVLELAPIENGQKERKISQANVYHASISKGKVEKEVLSTYVKDMRKSLHAGYSVFELAPQWDFHDVTSRTPAEQSEMKQIVTCERELSSKHKREGADF